jgi:hypothetical protein
MKKGWLTLMIVALTGLIFLTVGTLTASEKKAGDVPDEFMIDSEGYTTDKKGPVPMSHKKHVTEYGAKCDDCHHVFEDGKNVWKEGDPVQKCSECHDPVKKQGSVDKLQNAYHKNCKGCHKDAAAAGKTNAPYKKCNDCHEKRS